MSAPSLDNELSGIEAVILDVDDTIVDTRAATIAAASVALGALWPGRTDHAVLAERYYRDPARWFHRYAAGELAFDQMRLGRLRDIAASVGLEEPDDLTRVAFEESYLPAFAASQSLIAGTLEVVAAARARALRIGLLTNSAAEATRVKLDALGLGDTFDAVVTRDTLGFGKPDPRLYRHACEVLGAAPERSVCVGDNLEWDVLGAQCAGLRAVWLDTGDSIHNDGVQVPGRVVRIGSLHELAAALDRFGPRGPGR